MVQGFFPWGDDGEGVGEDEFGEGFGEAECVFGSEGLGEGLVERDV